MFTIGNSSRNPVRGPGYRDLDLAVIAHAEDGGLTDGTVAAYDDASLEELWKMNVGWVSAPRR